MSLYDFIKLGYIGTIYIVDCAEYQIGSSLGSTGANLLDIYDKDYLDQFDVTYFETREDEILFVEVK